jgi:hypothetical protein
VLPTHLETWVADRTKDVELLVAAMEKHLLDRSAWTGRDFNSSNAPIAWLRLVAELAAQHGHDGLLEDAATALVRSEVRWERFPQRHRTRVWLETLRSESAITVARAISSEPGAAKWLTDEGWSASANTHPAIRAALVVR